MSSTTDSREPGSSADPAAPATLEPGAGPAAPATPKLGAGPTGSTSPKVGAIDRVQLRALLRAYLRMSANGASLLRARGRPTTLVFVLVMYAFLGLVIGLGALARPGVLVYSLALHCLTFFTVGMAAIIESNDVLFDPNEEEILLHRPIPPGTLLAAKGLALVGFTLMLAGSLNFFPTFALLLARSAQPWIPLVHVLSTALLVVFVCAAVVCSYGLILKLFGRERFESLAVIAQVGMTLIFVGGFQILPRMIDRVGPERFDDIARILLPAPPAWFAAIDAALGAGAPDRPLLLAAGAGLLATIVLCWFAVGKLAEGYGSALPKHGTVPGGAEKEGASDDSPASVRKRSVAWGRPALLRRWMSDPIEWSAFRTAIAYIRRDREVKLRVYSSMSMFAVFVALSLIDRRRGRGEFLPQMMLAMVGTIPLTILESLRMSSHFAAAEIFYAAPLASSSSLFHGVRKATMLLVQLPIACAAIALIGVCSESYLDGIELALPILIALPTLSLAPGLFGSYVPLSMAPRRGRQTSQNIGAVFATMLVGGVLLGLAYAAKSLGALWILVAVELAVLIAAHRALLRVIVRKRMMPWSEG